MVPPPWLPLQFLAASALGRTAEAVATQALAAVGGDVTPPQYRTLMVLAERGPQRLAALARALEVHPSTVTGTGDRLGRKGLVRRCRLDHDPRHIRLALTETGRRLVDDVAEHRRSEIVKILRAVPVEARVPLIESLAAFAKLAGERDERHPTG